MSVNTMRVSVVSTGVALLLVAGLVTAVADEPAHRDRSAVLPKAPAAQQGIPRCDTKPFYRYAEIQSTTRTHVAGPNLPHNEAHDCQRMIINQDGGLVYGPLVALLVSTERISNTSDDYFSDGQVIADIVNFDRDEYRPLGIRPGVSCLWLKGYGPNDANWTARVISVPPRVPCTSVHLDTLPSTTLTVRRRSHGGTDYPSTGRWMWDSARLEQFIGVRCGYAICELGVEGFNPSPPFNEKTVPGWGDEQLLALPRRGTLPTVSGLLGRIDPSEELRHLQNTDFRNPAGAHVATITFKGGDARAREVYASKFHVACICSHVLHVYMKSEPADDSIVHKFSTDGGESWWPIIRSSRFQHAGRGAVRWAWSDKDEGGWIACHDGCCRTDCPPASPDC